MKKTSIYLALFLGPLFTVLAFRAEQPTEKLSFPYQAAGLTREQAAAHLLNRFSFGPTPGQISVVAKMGPEEWFKKQLEADFTDDSLQLRLNQYPSLKLSNTEIVETYPKPGMLVRKAIRNADLPKDSAANLDKKEYKEQVRDYMQANGLKPQAELIRELINQKILRAAYSQNQLQEVMTDFWFNHFNVSMTKGEDRQYITSYERDVIRPNSLGKFEDLLLATAKSPAMLTYLDNFRSVANNGQGNKKKEQGLNENYAREVMELHTLGVDGGYTQSDVTQAARVLTGWTIGVGNYGKQGENLQKRMDPQRMEKRGFVVEQDFFFNPNRHDQGEKTVLGKHFAANGGYEEGVELIHLLASSPKTAAFISKKLATRFVSDTPPQSLIDKMSKTFIKSNGDIKQVLITMVDAPEFWSAASLREKTKSPFELAISAVRSMNASVDAPYQLYTWITRMGQQIYYYQAPTGFPDRGQYWINTGSLLNRMNFGLALAAGKIPGVRIDLLALNQNHEPESSEAALLTYSKLLMPERDLSSTIKRLTPLLNDPDLKDKVKDAAVKSENKEVKTDEDISSGNQDPDQKKPELKKTVPHAEMLAQVVGIILGSPEFQRK